MFKRLVNSSVKFMGNWLPEPFVFAIILTVVVFICAIPIAGQSPVEVLMNWGNGVWDLLGFSMQMALVLVCGSTLADTVIVKKFLRKMACKLTSPLMAIATVTLISCVACWINWGFGLIVGAIFAKEIAKHVKGVDYRLLIASAYSGFVVWHAGLSASIPLAMATEGEVLREVTMGHITEAIPISQTVFATYNLLTVFLVIAVLTIVNTLMHPKGSSVVTVDPSIIREEDFTYKRDELRTPASRADNGILLTIVLSLFGFGFLFVNNVLKGRNFDLNTTIMLFLFLGIVFHKTPKRYIDSFTKSATSCAGILLQFPFYAGIMGIMTTVSQEGVSLAGEMSKACVSIANTNTFPLLSFLSAGIVNVFIPSGGGQWAVQAPIMIPAGVELGVNPAITGMAIAWGDAWTNLIQPFWALPALAIAKLSAKDIMGFCLIDLLVVGIIICAMFLIM